MNLDGQLYPGDNAYLRRDNMEIKPLSSDLGLLEELLKYVISSELNLDSKDHPFLFTEPNLHSKELRKHLVELMFESFSVPAFYISKTAALSSYSSGRSTSLVFDSGASMTTATPVHDGYVLQKSIVKYDIGGDFITDVLGDFLKEPIQPQFMLKKRIKLYTENGELQETPDVIVSPRECPNVTESYRNFSIREVVRDIKESALKVSDSTFNEMAFANVPNATYQLPDESILDIGSERFSIPELLFTPNEHYVGFNGVHQMIYDAITRCDMDIRKELYGNVIVAGGNSLFAGFTDRLSKHLTELTTQSLKVKLIASQSSIERKFSGWLGGSILASLGSFQQMWVSKQEYDEHGSELLERKCP